MRKDDCIFCKIVAGEIPSSTIYEDQEFKVILDLEPAAKGHALILPKQHFSNLYELDDKTASKALVLARNLAKKMTKALNCDGFNLLQNNGECAGQTVFHFHMHLIPRYEDDKVELTWEKGENTQQEREAIANLIKDA